MRLCHGQRRPSLSRSPPGPWNSAGSSTSGSTSARRRHDALATEWRSPESLSTAAAEPPCHAYKRSLELISARRQSQATSRGPPLAANRPGEASFLISVNRGRRHCPSHSGTTRASPSPFFPPRASSSFREPFPLLDFDRGSLRENFHSATEASLRHGARRRRFPPPPTTLRLPE